jgi:hypothetical protein
MLATHPFPASIYWSLTLILRCQSSFLVDAPFSANFATLLSSTVANLGQKPQPNFS